MGQKTKKCLKTLKGHNNGVEKAYFIDRDFILSIDRNQTLKNGHGKQVHVI